MNYLKKFRKMLNMSQETFGSHIGLSRATVGRIENNEEQLTERTIVTICSVFHVRREYLIHGEEPIWDHDADDLLKRLLDKYQLTDADIPLIYTFIQLPPEDRVSIIKFMDMFNQK